MIHKYLFIDRDGTLIHEPADFQIDSVEKFKLLPDVIPSLLALRASGYHLIMVTNQDGLGTEKNPREKFKMIQTLLMDIFETQGIRFADVLVCPHFEEDRCSCRKPNVGLVKEFMSMASLDRVNSRVIGDRKTDLTLAENMGLPGIQISADNGWRKITLDLLSSPRRGSTHRKTNETEVNVEVDLDGPVTTTIDTGIGFFDHMLEQLSKHGGFSLNLRVKGDIHVDEHHTIEDTALALGNALRIALGNKVGIQRFGFFLPMDDASSEVSLQVGVDLSGRSFFKFDGKFDRELVGGLATEMIPHFYKSLADGLQANLHLKIEGENAHHKVESSFKAVGRALRMAIQKTEDSEIPSTKGVL